MNSLQEKLRVVAEEHLGPLTERRDTLRAELAEVEKEIDAAEKAIAAASRSVDQAAAPAAKKTKKRAPQKASAPRDHVLKTIETVLADAGGKLDRDELLVETKEKLRGEGYGLTGLMQRFNKIVTEEDRFAARANSVSLKA